jgi:hypothetical protein
VGVQYRKSENSKAIAKSSPGKAAPGHLFLTLSSSGDVLGPLQGVKNRIGEFVRTVASDKNVAPSHAWRHRFRLPAQRDHQGPRRLPSRSCLVIRLRGDLLHRLGSISLVAIVGRGACFLFAAADVRETCNQLSFAAVHLLMRELMRFARFVHSTWA